MQAARPGPPVFSLGGPAPRDVWALVIGLFVLFAIAAFEGGQPLIRLLVLSRDALTGAQLWRLVTYAFTPQFSGFFMLISLLLIYMFGRDVFYRLGRRRFWTLLVAASAVGAVAALLTQLALDAAGFAEVSPAFTLMQGEQTLLLVLIAAFALAAPDAVIYLFFVIAVPARLLIALEMVLLFVAYLTTKDFAGLIGLYAAIGAAWLSMRRLGPAAWWGSWRSRFERWRSLRRFEKKRGKSPLRLVKPDDDRWVH